MSARGRLRSILVGISRDQVLSCLSLCWAFSLALAHLASTALRAISLLQVLARRTAADFPRFMRPPPVSGARSCLVGSAAHCGPSRPSRLVGGRSSQLVRGWRL